MSFNNHFNVKRFSRLFQQDLLINRTKYLLAIVGLGLISYVLCYLFLNGSKVNMIQSKSSIYGSYGICFVFYMMAVGVVVGTAFPDLTDKIKTSNYLLNPGSTFEKVILQFLIRIGLFVPIALFIFWIAIRLAKASLIPGDSGLDPAVIPYFEFRFLITRSTGRMTNISETLIMIFGIFSYGTYLFAGATYFKRYAIVKTVIASVVIFLISMSFSTLLSHVFYPEETEGFKIQLKDYPITEHLYSTSFFIFLLSLLAWMFFLAIAYFKLKEKEA